MPITIGEILADQDNGRPPITCSPDEDGATIKRKMVDNQLMCIAVFRGNEYLGILTSAAITSHLVEPDSERFRLPNFELSRPPKWPVLGTDAVG